MQCINIYYNYNLFKTRRIWACTKTIIQITFELYNTLLVMNILIFFYFIHITLLSALQLLQYHSSPSSFSFSMWMQVKWYHESQPSHATLSSIHLLLQTPHGHKVFLLFFALPLPLPFPFRPLLLGFVLPEEASAVSLVSAHPPLASSLLPVFSLNREQSPAVIIWGNDVSFCRH